MTSADRIRPLSAQDVDWVVELTRWRRESLAAHAPRFWNPADGATQRHRAHLTGLIDDPAVLTVGSAVGYLIAQDQGRVWLVDDAAVAGDADWGVQGVALLRHAQERCGDVRLVVPAFESRRMDAARAVGLRPVEHWWHRDLAAAGRTAVSGDPQLVVEGAAGRLVAAPPVYDPGGPVLLVEVVRCAEALESIEASAAARGATVSVVKQRPEDSLLAFWLSDAGYVETTAFCEPR